MKNTPTDPEPSSVAVPAQGSDVSGEAPTSPAVAQPELVGRGPALPGWDSFWEEAITRKAIRFARWIGRW